MKKSLKVVLTIGLSALLVTLGVSSVLSDENDIVNTLSQDAKSTTIEQNSSPASESAPLELDDTTTTPTLKVSVPPTTAEANSSTTQAPTPTQSQAPTRAAVPAAPIEPVAAIAPVVEPAPIETTTPEVPAAPIALFVEVFQEAPGSYFGTLEWSSVPGATEYRIYKTGTIRPTWRLFYVYPTSITSITISDMPGAIAIYKLIAVVNNKEVLIGEATYRPSN
jgi:hypothetical protein